MMRLKKPTHVLIDQVQITRDGNDAIIDHADPKLSRARITGIATMTDAEIVEMYNQILDSQWTLLEAWDKTVDEEPPGEESRSNITRTATSGSRAATCSGASSTTVGRTGKSSSISTTRSCR